MADRGDMAWGENAGEVGRDDGGYAEGPDGWRRSGGGHPDPVAYRSQGLGTGVGSGGGGNSFHA